MSLSKQDLVQPQKNVCLVLCHSMWLARRTSTAKQRSPTSFV